MNRRLTVISPPSRWAWPQFRELWEARELLYFFALRDFKVRYAQATLGIAWAVLQPVLMMVVFSIFLGHLAKVPSDGYPYAMFALAGLVSWTFFANALSAATNSLVASSNLVSRVYFPRLLVPLGALISWLPDLLAGTILLVVLELPYGIHPPVTIVFFPLFAVLALLAGAGAGVWLSALNVAYRDVRYAMGFLTQLWLFATPVAYPASLVPHRLRLLLGLNPMAGVVEGYRWAILGGQPAPWALVAISASVSLALLVAGGLYFRRVEQGFADVI